MARNNVIRHNKPSISALKDKKLLKMSFKLFTKSLKVSGFVFFNVYILRPRIKPTVSKRESLYNPRLLFLPLPACWISRDAGGNVPDRRSIGGIRVYIAAHAQTIRFCVTRISPRVPQISWRIVCLPRLHCIVIGRKRDSLPRRLSSPVICRPISWPSQIVSHGPCIGLTALPRRAS